MSWDFHMAVPIGRDGELVHVGHYEANYTYNVSRMFYRALGNEGIRGLHGKSGADAEPQLNAAVAAMRADPDIYRAMNPPNGWGNYEGALELLETLASWCREVPGAQLIIS